MRTPVKTWAAGARPRTLPAAVVPVVVGTSVAYFQNGACWGRAALALVVSLSMQVGVNYANDYSDGVRGTDDSRVGPARLVGGRLASPASVKRAALASFGIGAVAGLVLSLLSEPWLIAVGVACVAAGWFYTGGKRPYGYSGFGEVAVFVFFGIVATVGTAYVQERAFTSLELVASLPVGLLAVALLVVNNLRDRIGDSEAGKKTLAVRIGDGSTRIVYICCVALPFVVVPCVAAAYTAPWVLVALLSAPVCLFPVVRVVNGARGPDLVAVLGATGKVQMAFGILFAAGFFASAAHTVVR